MRQIELWTAGCSGFVAVVEIPPFPDAGMPGVIMWGDRVFALPSPSHPRWRYEEVFAVVSLTPSPGLPREAPAPAPPPVDRSRRETVGGERCTRCSQTPKSVAESAIRSCTDGGAHRWSADTSAGPDGQQAGYIVLAEEERSKGFVRPVRRSYRHEKCGSTTTMGVALAETYARDPGFYSGTFCARCKTHFPVGASGEFVWTDDGSKVGT